MSAHQQQVCSRCGHANRSEANYCAQCGQRVRTEGAATAADSLPMCAVWMDWERNVVGSWVPALFVRNDSMCVLEIRELVVNQIFQYQPCRSISPGEVGAFPFWKFKKNDAGANLDDVLQRLPATLSCEVFAGEHRVSAAFEQEPRPA